MKIATAPTTHAHRAGATESAVAFSASTSVAGSISPSRCSPGKIFSTVQQITPPTCADVQTNCQRQLHLMERSATPPASDRNPRLTDRFLSSANRPGTRSTSYASLQSSARYRSIGDARIDQFYRQVAATGTTPES